jgi:hypothetical protein
MPNSIWNAGLIFLTAIAAEAAQPTRLPIEAHLRILNFNRPTQVELSLRSLSSDGLSMQVSSVLIATPRVAPHGAPVDDAYWAPVDIASAKPYTADAAPELVLEPGHTLVVAIDLADLAWAPRRSSVWPRSSLSEAVPAGDYDVSYHLATMARSSERHITSESIQLRLP